MLNAIRVSVAMLNVSMLSVEFSFCYAECHYAECRYAECRYAECRSTLVTTLIGEPQTEIWTNWQNGQVLNMKES